MSSKFDRRGSAADLQGYRFAALDHAASAAARAPASVEVINVAACMHVVLVPGHCDSSLMHSTAFLDEVGSLFCVG